jgi:hypothetical protein
VGPGKNEYRPVPETGPAATGDFALVRLPRN